MDTLPVFEQIHVADYLRSPTKKTTHLPGEKSPPLQSQVGVDRNSGPHIIHDL
jgi:hypothetical protein